MSLYPIVPQLEKMLLNLDRWIDKAVAYADEKNFDRERLVEFRLAPDMYSLIGQVQAASDAAKFAVARVSGKEPPKHPDTEKTIAELRARIKSVVVYLGGFSPADFEGAEARVVPLPFAEGKGAKAVEYVHAMALPNFYFHVTTAYDILRHNGVDLGKRDFIGGMELLDL